MTIFTMLYSHCTTFCKPQNDYHMQNLSFVEEWIYAKRNVIAPKGWLLIQESNNNIIAPRILQHYCWIKVFSSEQEKSTGKLNCRNPGLNQGPLDLQCNALPTELGLGEDRLTEGGKGEKGEKKKKKGKKGKKGGKEEKEGKIPRSCMVPNPDINPSLHLCGLVGVCKHNS